MKYIKKRFASTPSQSAILSCWLRLTIAVLIAGSLAFAQSPPVITSVTPNPLTAGTITVTVNGTGFRTGATVFLSFGSYSRIQMSGTGSTAGSVSATRYLGTASSASFCVKNPGSACSNTIIVPVGQAGPPPGTYALTVVGGSGSGNYTAGTVVTITANAGQTFQSWTGATVANASSATTTLTMPAAATIVTAQFASNGGPVITAVSPNPLPTGSANVSVTGTGFGQYCLIWDGGVQYSTQGPVSNTLTAAVYMPAGSTTASFTVHCPGGVVSNTFTIPISGPPTYALTVVNGSGGGSYAAGMIVNIATNAPPAGQSFAGWTGANVGNANAASTTITMPAAPTMVTANFAAGPTYALTVVNGAGSGNYVAGAVVAITANNPPVGPVFLDWTGASVASANSATTTITMPASPTVVTANFSQPTYTLTVVNGSGSGNYTSGTVVQIAASAPPAGQYFQNWTGAAVASANQPATTITMPQSNAMVTANFYTPAPIPFPVSTHPRLWITQADLPRLQGWANSGNPIYVSQTTVLATSVSHYHQYFPGASLSAKNPVPASTYPDLGDTQGYAGLLTEDDAAVLAFNSLIDPTGRRRGWESDRCNEAESGSLNITARRFAPTRLRLWQLLPPRSPGYMHSGLFTR
jgi:hypothetical protein